MPARAPLRPWLVAALALLSGCSIANAPADHQQLSPVAADDFCDDLASRICDAHLRCCSTASITRDECISSWISTCANTVGSLAADPRTGYDARIAAEVLAEGAGFVESCATDVMPWVESRSGFQRVLAGTVTGGGDCTPRDPLDFPAYFSCTDLEQACLSAGPNRSVCADRLGVGAACDDDYDCAEDLWCEGTALFVLGHCATRRGVGEVCEENRACESLVCDKDGSGLCVVPTQDAVYCALEPL